MPWPDAILTVVLIIIAIGFGLYGYSQFTNGR